MYIDATKYRHARRCDATGEGMNEGYCVGDGIKYFKYKDDLVAYLRNGGDKAFNTATDEYILKEAYELEEYYWTEWPEVDAYDEFYDENGDVWNWHEVKAQFLILTNLINKDKAKKKHFKKLKKIINLMLPSS